MDGLTDEKAEAFVTKLAGFGHESPVEHVSFTFGIEGVSRSFLAQVTRHRIASFSVQSQRYVRKEQFVYVTPPAIAQHPDVLERYEQAMQTALDAYNTLADQLDSITRNSWQQAVAKKQLAPKQKRKPLKMHGMCCRMPVKQKWL